MLVLGKFTTIFCIVLFYQVIAPNEELKVWYASHYAQQLGKQTFKEMMETDIEEDNVEPNEGT